MDCKSYSSRQVEAERYLRKITYLERLISAKEKELDALRYKASGSGAIRYDKDRVQTSPADYMVMAMADIISLSEEIDKDREQLNLMKSNAYSIVRMMDNHEHRALIEWFYFNGLSIADLSERMNLSKRTAYYLRDAALESFGCLLRNNKK